MAACVDPSLRRELEAFGGEDISACMNCGNCTATCGLVTENNQFPRKTIRYLQLGLRERLRRSLEPWLCYYCGDCCERCPRNAHPGETMMAVRRWLTTQYEWTGLSRLMYQWAWLEAVVLLAVAAVVVGLFTLPADFGFRLLAKHPEALSTVRLDLFAPRETVHIADALLAMVLAALLFSSALRMVGFVMKGRRATAVAWIASFTDLAIHAFTQRRWRDCTRPSARLLWLRHILLVSGYGTIFVLVVVFLNAFQVENATWQWTSILGYYACLMLLGASITILYNRVRKSTPMHEYSHLSDWLFPILLLLTALSGMALHVLRLMDLPMPTYVAYVVHLAIAVPMLVVEVPFGKWGHLLYRPLAQYLQAVQERPEPVGVEREAA
jgi:ferredoxin